MSPDKFLVANADDVATVLKGRNADMVQMKLNQVMKRVTKWTTNHGLQTATQKTELLLLTRKRIETRLMIEVDTERIETSDMKYLGVTLDMKWTFWPHIQKTVQKAAKRISFLSRLMANTNRPRQGKRKLLMATTHSILLYRSEIWGGILKTKKYCKAMTLTQRQGALRIASAYRTVLAQAALVVAGVIPVDLLAFERKKIYERSVVTAQQDAAETERTKALQTWQ